MSMPDMGPSNWPLPAPESWPAHPMGFSRDVWTGVTAVHTLAVADHAYAMDIMTAGWPMRMAHRTVVDVDGRNVRPCPELLAPAWVPADRQAVLMLPVAPIWP